MIDPCAKCEEVLSPISTGSSPTTSGPRLRRTSTVAATAGSATVEESLRRYVREAAAETMPPELKKKLAALRTRLV